jgi:hypothetical protein
MKLLLAVYAPKGVFEPRPPPSPLHFDQNHTIYQLILEFDRIFIQAHEFERMFIQAQCVRARF